MSTSGLNNHGRQPNKDQQRNIYLGESNCVEFKLQILGSSPGILSLLEGDVHGRSLLCFAGHHQDFPQPWNTQRYVHFTTASEMKSVQCHLSGRLPYRLHHPDTMTIWYGRRWTHVGTLKSAANTVTEIIIWYTQFSYGWSSKEDNTDMAGVLYLVQVWVDWLMRCTRNLQSSQSTDL